MSMLALERLKDDAFFYVGDSVEKVQEQWAADSEIAYQFDHYLNGAPALPMRFKVMLNLNVEAITAVTLNLCVPFNCMGLNASALVHLTLRSLVEIFEDKLVGIVYFENQSVKELDKPDLKHFKTLPILKKNVNLLHVLAYLRGVDGFADYDSIYVVELDNLRKAESLKAFTELFTQRQILSEGKSRAEELFTKPMIDFFAVKSDQERKRMIGMFDQFKNMLALQVNESLEGNVELVITTEFSD